MVLSPIELCAYTSLGVEIGLGLLVHIGWYGRDPTYKYDWSNLVKPKEIGKSALAALPSALVPLCGIPLYYYGPLIFPL